LTGYHLVSARLVLRLRNQMETNETDYSECESLFPRRSAADCAPTRPSGEVCLPSVPDLAQADAGGRR
jgi:hypothetical protein